VTMKIRAARTIILLTILIAVGLGTASAGPVRNVNDLEALKAQAGQSKKLVAIFVTSSDANCGDCARMRKDFFRDPAFTDWINRFSVYGEIDTGKQGKSKQEIEAMAALVQAAHVPFTPTMVLLHPDGSMLEYQTANHVANQTATLFHEIYLDRMVGVSQPGVAKVSLSPNAVSPAGKNNTPPTPDVWNPPNAVPVRYDALKLRSITGTGARQFVLINDQTLALGERARVTVNGKKVSVKCLEIRTGQVVVEVEGDAKPKLLVLESTRVKSASTR